jgi:hypothetical protein
MKPNLRRTALPNFIEDIAARNIRDICDCKNLEGFAAVVEAG